MLHSFQTFIRSEQLFQKNDLLIVAVSGGADSVALCELCHQADFHFEIAHCNFRLRGEESDRDEQFVKDLAAKFQVPFHHIAFDTNEYAQENKVSTQIAARELRYTWFDKLVAERKGTGSAFLLTAHHGNDAIETLLMNFFKGTGIRGLQGIPVKNGHVIRPLLFVTKKQILNFLAANDLPFVEDSSNLSDKYTRNYFRNQLIPSIEKIFPGAEENLLDNLERFHEISLLYDEAILQHKKKLVEQKGKETHIPVLKLLKLKPLKTVLYEILKPFHFLPGQLTDVISLLHSKSGKFVLSPTHRILRNRDWLIITPLEQTISTHILVEEGQKNISFEKGRLIVEKKPFNSDVKIPADSKMAILDAGEIVFPLLLRKWKQGDYFYPLGMRKKKKLSRFFIDRKLSIPEKENTWVLEQDRKIVWIVGQRIDDRFKVTESTKEIFVIQWIS